MSSVSRAMRSCFSSGTASRVRMLCRRSASLIKITRTSRTLEAVPLEKQERIARETLDIYAPIANRLGLIALYYELEDLGFNYLHPTRFRVLEKALKKARGNRRDAVGKIQEAIQNRLREYKVEAQVTGREKHIS